MSVYVPPARLWLDPEVEKHCLGRLAVHLQLLAGLAPKLSGKDAFFAHVIKSRRSHLWKVFGGNVKVELTIDIDLPA